MDPSYYANLPADAPPPGVVSNFDHPDSRAIAAHIGMGICMGVTLIFVILRAYVKLAITHLWGWDDCESFDILRNIERELRGVPRGLYIRIRKALVYSITILGPFLTVPTTDTDRSTRCGLLY